MASQYLKSTFIIDILATVPFDSILSMFDFYIRWRNGRKQQGLINWVELLGIFKIGRVLRI